MSPGILLLRLKQFFVFISKIFFSMLNSAMDLEIAGRPIYLGAPCVPLTWLHEMRRIQPGPGQIFCESISPIQTKKIDLIIRRFMM
jgi:hypothetical protein